jgi:hypothetical protein
MSLSERLRPQVEAAPWVIEEVKQLERLLEQALEALEPHGSKALRWYTKEDAAIAAIKKAIPK